MEAFGKKRAPPYKLNDISEKSYRTGGDGHIFTDGVRSGTQNNFAIKPSSQSVNQINAIS